MSEAVTLGLALVRLALAVVLLVVVLFLAGGGARRHRRRRWRFFRRPWR